MPKVHMLDVDGTIRPTGELHPPIVIKGPAPPKPPRRWRAWPLFLRDWVARPAIGVLVRDAVEWLLGQLFRRRRPTKAATS